MKNKKKIIVFIDYELQEVVKTNYTFNLRIKSNLDYSCIQDNYDLKYIRIDKFRIDEILNGNIFIFYKAQFFLPSVRMLISILKKLKKIVLFDIDDYYLDVPDYSFGSHLNHGTRIETFKKNLIAADLIISSTEFLKQQLLEFNQNIIVVENTMSNLHLKEASSIGSTFNILITSNDNLKLTHFRKDFIKCLRDLKKEYRDRIKLIFLGKFTNIENLDILADSYYDRVPPDDYIDFLKSNNINLGLVPLGGDEDKETLISHSCKSNIKFLEFANFGIAGIFSNVEPYKNIINMEDGIVVNNTYGEWYNAIKKLIENPERCLSLVKNSQVKVRDNYSKKISMDKWFNIFDNCKTDDQVTIVKSKNMKIIFVSIIIKIRYNYNKLLQKMLFVMMLVKKRNFKEILLRSKNFLMFRN